jgi:hypothetical protein
MASHNITQKNKWQTIPSASKTTGTVFWDGEGWTLVEFLPPGKTINAAHYLQMLQKRHHHALCDKCPEKEKITLQQDNT